ncbi:MAG: hypothetical protein HY297_06240 [Thaumarchaeota archaeon]|nr:hypothetical protein [Nitrososphaerota archaeon]
MGLRDFLRRNRVAIVVLSVGAALRSLVMLVVKPLTDVYYYDTEAARALVQGVNPYGHFYGGLPLGILTTPGAANVFTYLPFTAMFFVPFYLAGDVRLGLILADIIIGACFVWAGLRRSLLASSVYLFFPFTILLSTVFLNNTVVSMLFIALFFALERRGRGLLGATCFGIALATVQFSWFVFPFVAYYYLRGRRWKEPLLIVGVAALIIAPYFVANPSAFVFDTLMFQFVRPTVAVVSYFGPLGYYVNLALNAILLSVVHASLPLYARVGLVGAILPVFLYKMKGSQRLALYSGLYLLLSVFVLSNDFFISYTELPFLLLLFYATTPRGKKTLKAIGRRRRLLPILRI